MGYHSDVRMVIRGPVQKILDGFAHLRLTGDDVMCSALDEWEVKAVAHSSAVAILGRGGVDWKWYESYPDVVAHNTIFHYFQDVAESIDSDVIGAFVRIGENDDDIETAYFGGEFPADLARPVRSIDCEYDSLSGDDLHPRVAQTSA